LIAEVVGSVASALRRLAATPTPPTTIEPLPSAIVILDEHLAVQSWTANAGPWFDAFAGKLPPVGVNARCAIYAAAAHCLAQPDPDRGGSRVRLRLDDGRWAVADAARLNGIANGVAVSVRQAGISDVLDVLSGAYGLTARERQLVTLVVEGLDTRELATRLFISPNTVQQHLKSVFNKLGVRSRRELVTDIFRQPT
jgi:DNA-binding CsgD family transcriptional regulator